MWRLVVLNLVLLGLTLASPLGTELENRNSSHPEIPLTNVDSSDICRQGPMKSDSLIACEGYTPMYTFSHETGTCEGFIYGGCGGSENLFATRNECEERCKRLNRETRSVDDDGDLLATD